MSESLIAVGTGDLVLASIDVLLATPFVDERGAFRSPAFFREPVVPPSSRLQADAGGVSSTLAEQIESHYDAAVFHWVRPTVRLRCHLGSTAAPPSTTATTCRL